MEQPSTARQKGIPLTAEQRRHRRKKRITAGIVCGAVVLLTATVLTALFLYGKQQAGKIPAMSFEECLAYTLDGSEDGIITVGVIKDGKATYTVYGEGGKELAKEPRAYEIGSLTKTFTAALIQKAVAEGRIDLDDTIDNYLSLPAENSYPTIAALLTHTSGYKGYYLEAPMVRSFFADRNEFCGITDEMVQGRLKSLSVKETAYSFLYSNFGYAVLGQVLESVYGKDYTSLVHDFTAALGLSSTHLSSGKSALPNGWDWCESDAYLPAGALVSDIEDMLRYAAAQLDGSEPFATCHTALKQVDASSSDNKAMGIRLDAVGMAWITDRENGIVWHNGGTGHYNCYLGFCEESGTAVVILSNLAPSYRIPATVMGVKLLTD